MKSGSERRGSRPPGEIGNLVPIRLGHSRDVCRPSGENRTPLVLVPNQAPHANRLRSEDGKCRPVSHRGPAVRRIPWRLPTSIGCSFVKLRHSVQAVRFELTTPCSRNRCATMLRHARMVISIYNCNSTLCRGKKNICLRPANRLVRRRFLVKSDYKLDLLRDTKKRLSFSMVSS